MSIKKIAVKEVRQFHLIPLDKLEVWENNLNRCQSNHVEEIAIWLRNNAVKENTFNPNLVPFGTGIGFIPTDRPNVVCLTDGFQRMEALKILEKEGVKVLGMPVQIIPCTTAISDLLLQQINTETTQKTPFEVSIIFKALRDKGNLSQKQISESTRYSPATVSNYLKFQDNSNKRLIDLVKENLLSFEAALELLRQLPKGYDLSKDEKDLDSILDRVLGGELSSEIKPSEDNSTEIKPSEDNSPPKKTGLTKKEVQQRLNPVSPVKKTSEADRKAWFQARQNHIIELAEKLALEANQLEVENGKIILEHDPAIWYALVKAVRAELPQ